MNDVAERLNVAEQRIVSLEAELQHLRAQFSGAMATGQTADAAIAARINQLEARPSTVSLTGCCHISGDLTLKGDISAAPAA